MTRINDEEDVAKLQDDLVSIYSWATRNHMKWNDLMFQVLRLGSKVDIIENTTIFSPDYGDIVEYKESIKDLGLYVDSTLKHKAQLAEAEQSQTKGCMGVEAPLKPMTLTF